LIKCRKVESRQAVIAMINKVQELKGYHDSYNQQVMSNILEVILVLPYVYEIEALPI
jgi:NADH:ubiquinone oxidoreductase subunit E